MDTLLRQIDDLKRNLDMVRGAVEKTVKNSISIPDFYHNIGKNKDDVPEDDSWVICLVSGRNGSEGYDLMPCIAKYHDKTFDFAFLKELKNSSITVDYWGYVPDLALESTEGSFDRDRSMEYSFKKRLNDDKDKEICEEQER